MTMLRNPQPTTNYSQHALIALSQFELKIQRNIEEQPMDVKGLVVLLKSNPKPRS
jgi:hypothetical protein